MTISEWSSTIEIHGRVSAVDATASLFTLSAGLKPALLASLITALTY